MQSRRPPHHRWWSWRIDICNASNIHLFQCRKLIFFGGLSVAEYTALSISRSIFSSKIYRRHPIARTQGRCTGYLLKAYHHNDVIISAMASQITSLTIVYSTIFSGTDQRKHQRSASLAFLWGIHRWPVNSPHKGPVTQKMFPFDDVIMAFKRSFSFPPFASCCIRPRYIESLWHLPVCKTDSFLFIIWRRFSIHCAVVI